MRLVVVARPFPPALLRIGRDNVISLVMVLLHDQADQAVVPRPEAALDARRVLHEDETTHASQFAQELDDVVGEVVEVVPRR